MKSRSKPSPSRQRIWLHNSFLGHAALMRKNCQAIIDADSTTPEAKAVASLILEHARDLEQELKERVDPK